MGTAERSRAPAPSAWAAALRGHRPGWPRRAVSDSERGDLRLYQLEHDVAAHPDRPWGDPAGEADELGRLTSGHVIWASASATARWRHWPAHPDFYRRGVPAAKRGHPAADRLGQPVAIVAAGP